MNTLLKYFRNRSALSWSGFVYADVSSSCEMAKSGIPALVLIFVWVYFQKFLWFGLVLMSKFLSVRFFPFLLSHLNCISPLPYCNTASSDAKCLLIFPQSIYQSSLNIFQSRERPGSLTYSRQYKPIFAEPISASICLNLKYQHCLLTSSGYL